MSGIADTTDETEARSKQFLQSHQMSKQGIPLCGLQTLCVRVVGVQMQKEGLDRPDPRHSPDHLPSFALWIALYKADYYWLKSGSLEESMLEHSSPSSFSNA